MIKFEKAHDTFYSFLNAPQWETADAEIKVPSVENQSLKVFTLKPEAVQYIDLAMHATLTARDFFFADFYTPAPFTHTFPKPFPRSYCVSCR